MEVEDTSQGEDVSRVHTFLERCSSVAPCQIEEVGGRRASGDIMMESEEEMVLLNQDLDWIIDLAATNSVDQGRTLDGQKRYSGMISYMTRLLDQGQTADANPSTTTTPATATSTTTTTTMPTTPAIPAASSSLGHGKQLAYAFMVRRYFQQLQSRKTEPHGSATKVSSVTLDETRIFEQLVKMAAQTWVQQWNPIPILPSGSSTGTMAGSNKTCQCRKRFLNATLGGFLDASVASTAATSSQASTSWQNLVYAMSNVFILQTLCGVEIVPKTEFLIGKVPALPTKTNASATGMAAAATATAAALALKKDQAAEKIVLEPYRYLLVYISAHLAHILKCWPAFWLDNGGTRTLSPLVTTCLVLMSHNRLATFASGFYTTGAVTASEATSASTICRSQEQQIIQKCAIDRPGLANILCRIGADFISLPMAANTTTTTTTETMMDKKHDPEELQKKFADIYQLPLGAVKLPPRFQDATESVDAITSQVAQEMSTNLVEAMRSEIYVSSSKGKYVLDKIRWLLVREGVSSAAVIGGSSPVLLRDIVPYVWIDAFVKREDYSKDMNNNGSNKELMTLIQDQKSKGRRLAVVNMLLQVISTLAGSITNPIKANKVARVGPRLLKNIVESLPSPTLQDQHSKMIELVQGIDRQTWRHLGVECHDSLTARFALAKPTTPVMAANMNAEKPKLLLRAVQDLSTRKVEYTSTISASSAQEGYLPLLLQLFLSIRPAPQKLSKASTKSLQQQDSTAAFLWQTRFLRSLSVHVFILAFMDAFRQLTLGPIEKFDVGLAQLLEVMDFEVRTGGGSNETGIKNVQALFQTILYCRDARRAQEENELWQTEEATAGTLTNKTVADSQTSQQKLIQSTTAYPDSLFVAAFRAMEEFFEGEHGLSLPRLNQCFEAESKFSDKMFPKAFGGSSLVGDKGVKRPLGGGPGGSPGGALSATTTGGTGVGIARGSVLGASSIVDMDAGGRKKVKTSAEASAYSGGGGRGKYEGLQIQGIIDDHQDESRAASAGSTTSTATFEKSKGSTPSTPVSSTPTVVPLISSHFLVKQSKLTKQSLAQSVIHTSLSTSSAMARAQAKLSNPLWSPIMGQTFQTTYRAPEQIMGCLDRWMVLLSHMDITSFSERLFDLVKAVYPSDQKFLLDQILMEYMMLDQHKGPGYLRNMAVSTSVVHKSQESSSSPTSSSTASPARLQTEGIIEMVMKALVGLVIKPEDRTTHYNAGAVPWSEPTSTTAESLDLVELDWNAPLMKSHTAVDKAPNTIKKEQVGEVHPEAARTAITSLPSTTTSTTIPSTTATATPSPTGTAFATTSAAAATAALRQQQLLAAKNKRKVRSVYNRRVSPFYMTLVMFQKRKHGQGHVGVVYLDEVSTGPTEAGKDGRYQAGTGVGASKNSADSTFGHSLGGGRGGLGGSGSTYGGRNNRSGSIDGGGGGGGSANNRKRGKKGKLRRYNDPDMEQSEDKSKKYELDFSGIAGKFGQNPNSISISNRRGNKSKSNANTKSVGEDQVIKERDDHQVGGDEEMHDTEDEEADMTEMWSKDASDQKMLQMAQSAETDRMGCQAPAHVLLSILKCLTSMNQGGALDAWIVDALTSTISQVQDLYLDWIVHALGISTDKDEHVVPASSTYETLLRHSWETTPASYEELVRIAGVVAAIPGGTGLGFLQSALQRWDQRGEWVPSKPESRFFQSIRDLTKATPA